MRLRVGEFARVGDALVVATPRASGCRAGRGSTKCAGEPTAPRRATSASTPRRSPTAPRTTAGRRQPQRQRRHDQIVGREHIHRQQDRRGRTGPSRRGRRNRRGRRSVCAFRKTHAEEERAGQERQEVEQEIGEQPPLLRRVGDQEDGVERHLLRDEVARRPSAARTAAERDWSRRRASGARTSPWRRTSPRCVRPKPSIARLTTSEPKCAQLPTEKTRMMPICSAMTRRRPARRRDRSASGGRSVEIDGSASRTIGCWDARRSWRSSVPARRDGGTGVPRSAAIDQRVMACRRSGRLRAW